MLRHKHFSLRDNPAGLATSLAPGSIPWRGGCARLPETPRQRLLKDLLYISSGRRARRRSRCLKRCAAPGPPSWSKLAKNRDLRRPCALLPGSLARYVMHFEAAIEDAVANFADALPRGVRVLDAGAGEDSPQTLLRTRSDTADWILAVGDSSLGLFDNSTPWGSGALPFRDATFDAALNIVTLEHVRASAIA